MAAPAAAAAGGGAYIGLAVAGAGLLYLISPPGQRTLGGLADAMGDAGSAATDQVVDLWDYIMGNSDSQSVSTTREGAMVETPDCPLTLYVHYTDSLGVAGIIASVSINGRARDAKVFLTDAMYGPNTVWNLLFIGAPEYRPKANFFCMLVVNCTVPIVFSEALGPMNEYIHIGRLRLIPPRAILTSTGPNIFPEHPNFAW